MTYATPWWPISCQPRHRFASFAHAGRTDGPCKFGSRKWPASRRLARTVLAAVMHSSPKNHCLPALIIVSLTRGDTGTQLHNCGSDSRTSRWRFLAVGVIAAAALLFLAPLHWTRCFSHCYSAPWLRAGGPRAAHHRGDVLRLRGHWLSRLVFATGCSRPLSSCIFSPCARLPSADWVSTSGRRRARLGHSTSSGLALTLSPNSWSSASVAGFVPAPPNKGNTVSRVRTVVLVNTSSTS